MSYLPSNPLEETPSLKRLLKPCRWLIRLVICGKPLRIHGDYQVFGFFYIYHFSSWMCISRASQSSWASFSKSNWNCTKWGKGLSDIYNKLFLGCIFYKQTGPQWKKLHFLFKFIFLILLGSLLETLTCTTKKYFFFTAVQLEESH